MKTTARFEIQRSKELNKLFTKKRMVELWRKLVRNQMRSLDIKDLHDYYDFNFAIEAKVDGILEKVLSGLYRAEAPLVYKMEKKYGVCRHMMVPSPSDALVFQVLTDELHGALIKAQPSKGAYYSRDRHFLSLPHEKKEAASYPWFILWPKFQEEVWKFSKSYKFIVTTDLANYFDNIGLRELRHVVSSLAKTKEVYLDLLFSLIEDLSWRPDYLPTSNKGLPTINIEAPRLLAHSLLFEVDDVLKERTGDNFVRWMDDINFGVKKAIDANVILGEINDVLKSRGLALNLAKTAIMSPKEAQYHFMFKENVRLTKVQKRADTLKSDKAKHNLAIKNNKEFKSHLNCCDARNKDKVTKRYLTILGKLKNPIAVKYAVDLFVQNPGMRSSVLTYISKIKFSKIIAKQILRIIDDIDHLDNVTFFQIVDMLTQWNVPYDHRGKWFVSEVIARLSNYKDPFSWLCLVNFLAKYGEPHEVLNIVSDANKFGAKEAFFSRQAMAVVTRGIGINSKSVLNKWAKEISTGSSDSASVANNLQVIWDHGFPSKKHRLYQYLFPTSKQTAYQVYKFLILCVIAKSEHEKGLATPRPVVQEYVANDWYIHWLKEINSNWFKEV